MALLPLAALTVGFLVVSGLVTVSYLFPRNKTRH